MITRFYVDNYKCLQNFEYRPKPFELVVGANGSGKSTVFEALDKVRQFISGKVDIKELFPESTITRWSARQAIVFEIDFTFENSLMQYRLETAEIPVFGVWNESLQRDGEFVFETHWGEKTGLTEWGDEYIQDAVRLMKLNGESDSAYPLSNPERSAMGAFINFHQRITLDLLFVKLNPPRMTSQIKRPQSRPKLDLSDFSSFYIHALQTQQGNIFRMIPCLKEVIGGFDSFIVEEDYEEAKRELFILCRSGAAEKHIIKYSLDELSDGQRALIALYTLLFCTLDKNSTLVIDEPENYIALRELQPWLMLLQERQEETGGQVILISHHPEFINALAEQTTFFERDGGGPVRIKEFNTDVAKTLAPAEIMARGWES